MLKEIELRGASPDGDRRCPTEGGRNPTEGGRSPTEGGWSPPSVGHRLSLSGRYYDVVMAVLVVCLWEMCCRSALEHSSKLEGLGVAL